MARRSAGHVVQFDAMVCFSGPGSIHGSGTVVFPNGHGLHVSTREGGTVDSCPIPACRHGCVFWWVEGGEGQFAGARGMITSTFLLREDGQIVDTQVGVIFVQ